jgi:hypothetical protein
MKQAIHIFSKDLRYLWREVWVVLLLAAMFVYSVTADLAGITGVLFEVAACWMIARLIQAELLVGDNQFWITRPYAWKALLGSKIAFLFAFVQMPILFIHLAILIRTDFPLWSSVSGLLWAQLLFWICMSLPLATLAAITSGLVPLVITILVVPVAALAVDLYFPLFGIALGTALGPLEWVKDTIAAVGIAVIAGVVLYFQYRKRATVFSRLFLAVVAALALATYMYLPWPVAFAVQSRLPSKRFDASSVQIGLAEPGPLLARGIGNGDQARVAMRLSVVGVPAGGEVRVDALDMEFHWPDKSVSTARLIGMDKRAVEGNVFSGWVPAKRSLPPEMKTVRVNLRGSLYVTLFGNTQSRAIAMQKKPVNVIDNIQCHLVGLPVGVFGCRAPFRWPAGLVSAAFGQNDIRTLGQAVSYSPFPAELGLNPVEGRLPSGAPTKEDEVTIRVKEPIAHIRRDFALGEVALESIASYEKYR